MTDAPKSFRCSACGSLNRVHLQACWLCHKSLDPETDELVGCLPGAEPAPEPDRLRQGIDALRGPSESGRDTTVVVIVAAIAVICLGAFLIQPGVGIMLAIVSIIPMVRTTMLVSRRAGATSRLSAVLLFLSSMVVTWIIVAVVAVAAAATYCLTCLGVAVSRGQEQGYVIAGAAALAVVVIGGLAFRKWITARWHRDVSEG